MKIADERGVTEFASRRALPCTFAWSEGFGK